MDNKELIEFNFNGNGVRTITDEQTGEPWFVGRDVAFALGYISTENAISRHCKASKTCPIETGGQVRDVKIIPERDVYRLIIKSKLPASEKFEEWVVGEVLPSIRKHGAYMTPDVLTQATSDPDFMIGLLQNLKDTQVKLKEAVETKAQISDAKTATAMQTASVLKRENNKLKDKYEDPDYTAVRAHGKFFKEYFGKNIPWGGIGLDMKNLSDTMGFDIKYMAHAEFRKINLYHKEVFRKYKAKVECEDLRVAVLKHLI